MLTRMRRMAPGIEGSSVVVLRGGAPEELEVGQGGVYAGDGWIVVAAGCDVAVEIEEVGFFVGEEVAKGSGPPGCVAGVSIDVPIEMDAGEADSVGVGIDHESRIRWGEGPGCAEAFAGRVGGAQKVAGDGPVDGIAGADPVVVPACVGGEGGVIGVGGDLGGAFKDGVTVHKEPGNDAGAEARSAEITHLAEGGIPAFLAAGAEDGGDVVGKVRCVLGEGDADLTLIGGAFGLVGGFAGAGDLGGDEREQDHDNGEDDKEFNEGECLLFLMVHGSLFFLGAVDV